MSGHTGNAEAPPTYAEALRYESRASSDPSLGPRRVQPSAPSYEDSYVTVRRGRSLNNSRRQSLEDVDISDSSHSSDDEETSRLRAELRRVREDKKKRRLRDALERERNALRGASGTTPSQSPQSDSVSAPIRSGFGQGPAGTTHRGDISQHSSQTAPSTNPACPAVTYSPEQGAALLGSVTEPSQVLAASTAPADEVPKVSHKCACCYVFLALAVVLAVFLFIIIHFTR